MNHLSGTVWILGLTLTAGSFAADDLAVVNRIKDQAFNHSQVVEYMHYLADENGPRLAASPGYRRAAHWAVDTLRRNGLENARLEAFGAIGRSWSWSGISVQMVPPNNLNNILILKLLYIGLNHRCPQICPQFTLETPARSHSNRSGFSGDSLRYVLKM